MKCSKELLVTLLTFFLVFKCQLSTGKSVDFEDCGKGQVKSLDISPCEEEPCKFIPGEVKHVSVKFDAISGQSFESSENKMIVDFVSIDVEYPGVADDICEKLKCPLVPGNNYNYTFQVEVKEYLPIISTNVTWQAGSYPYFFCASTKVIFGEKKKD